MNNNDALQYRKAADKVWEMAREYEEKGEREIANAIKDLAVQLHDLARKSEDGLESKPNG